MPIDARIPLGVTPVDPNGFTNALAAGMKMRQTQNESDRLAYKDEAAVRKSNALANFYQSPRGEEDVATLAREAPDAVSGIEKNTREAQLADVQAKKAKAEGAKADIALMREASQALATNPTDENFEATIAWVEPQLSNPSMSKVWRSQWTTSPPERRPALANAWAMTAEKAERLVMDQAKANAPQKPQWDPYKGQFVTPPATGAGPEAAAPPGTVVPGGELPPPEDINAAARHRAGQGPAPTGNVDYSGLSDEGLDELQRTSTFQKGNKPAASTPPVGGQATPVDGQPAPVVGQPPPPPPPPLGGGPYRSRAEAEYARDQRQIAKDAEAQRVAQETLKLRQGEAAARERRRTQPTPQAAQKNREKLQTLDIIDTRLDDVEAAFMGPKNPDGTRKAGGIEGSFSVGLLGGYLPSTGGRAYDGAVDGLRPFLRQISRTPGEGAMSDYETKQAEALLPSRNDHPSVVKQKIQQIRNIVKQSRLGIINGPGAPAEPGPAAPSPAPVKAPQKEFDAMPMPGEHTGKRIKTDTGQVYRSNGREWVRE